MEEEIWKRIPGYNSSYEVSDWGRVKSLERTVNVRGGGYRKISAMILKPISSPSGYYRVCVLSSGGRKMRKIHQLVAAAFLDYIPDGKTKVINHIDGNRLNNHAKNIEVVTQRQNLSTCFRKDRDRLSSKFVGVCWHKRDKKWMASIYINGKIKYLGLFFDEGSASKSYQNELKIIKNI